MEQNNTDSNAIWNKNWEHLRTINKTSYLDTIISVCGILTRAPNHSYLHPHFSEKPMFREFPFCKSFPVFPALTVKEVNHSLSVVYSPDARNVIDLLA